MSALPILTGIVSSVLGLAQIAGWLALGSFALPRSLDVLKRVVVAILIGSGVTGAVYAILTYSGHVDAAIGLCTFLSLGSLILRVRWVIDAASAVWSELRPLLKTAWSRVISLALCALYWVDSIVPPRDGDVMRYHLAHIRQIIRDGRWAPLPEYTYALPFGWTINYLPFERLHLVESAHVVNLVLWLLALTVMASIFRREGAPLASYLLLLFVALHPLVLKSATTAHADLYAVFVVLAIVLFLIDLPTDNASEMTLLGFVSTIGAQSRYQLLGVSVVVFLIGVWYVVTKRASIRLFGMAIAGAVMGLIVASPFYVVNYLSFRNPFWPLLVAKINGVRLYADRVADNVNRSLTGAYNPAEFFHSFSSLLVDPIAFPIPAFALVLLLAPLWSRDRAVRIACAFDGLFLLVWAMVQPSLYSRFSMLLIPAIGIGLGLSWRSVSGKKTLNAMVSAGGALACAALFVFDLHYSKDSARYVVTGDETTFHEATWYYPVYQWVNETTPPDSRFLVIVASGHSYYLERSYRRADPFLSGYIDWDAVASDRELQDILTCSHFDYVIYHLTAAAGQPGGANLDRVVRSATDHGFLTIARAFDLTLVTRRVSGEGIHATVWVLRRMRSPNSPNCASVKSRQPFLD